MTEPQPPAITPRDVFARCNMPSRWERITNVNPKIARDRKYLAYLAARYLNEERLPDPGELVPPDELRMRERVGVAVTRGCLFAFLVMIIGFTGGLPVLTVVGGVIAAVALAIMGAVWMETAGAVNEYALLQSRCAQAQSRLRANPLHPRYRSTLDQMINCDEGTLAYCAAKIASEIRREPAWNSEYLELLPIDLFEELAEIAQSARQISDERKATESLECNRLRDDPEVQEMIAADKQRREESIGLLAARVHAFADYRDRLVRRGMAAVREKNTANRAMRLAADEVAIDRLR